MAKKFGKRIYRKATKDERKRHRHIREQVAGELPSIKRRAKQKLAKAIRRGFAIQHAVSVLILQR